MALGSGPGASGHVRGRRRAKNRPLSEINVTPLVDVMLVLLVIFIITAPLLTHSVKIDLPKASSSPNITQPEHIEFALQDDSTLYWNGEPVTMDQLAPRFTAAVQQNSTMELHIRADKRAMTRATAS